MYLFFLYAVALLIFPIKRIISSEKWFQTTWLFCNLFFENAKNLDNANASLNSSCAPPPQPPQATAGHLLPLSVPGVGYLQILHCSGAGHLPTPGPLVSFSHARSFLSEYNYSEGFIGSPVKDRNELKRVVKVWSQFYACISSLHIKMELHSKNRSYQCQSTCFGY